ncbi:hypothetical protein [uncultured Cohaesibacter sp.]|uniref:hypothetical protein n=1 Tax=uncultured Cohaesibacter sp. TaxID=1002546 RepID=UPI0029C762F5|nr:hypothetical protein [uncultured Cohaesibacter sp.]
MKIYHKNIIIRANQIGLVTNEAFLDACQELMDAQSSVDVGSVYTQHLGDRATELFKNIHNWRMGGAKNEK